MVVKILHSEETDLNFLKNLVAVARGDQKAGLLLKTSE